MIFKLFIFQDEPDFARLKSSSAHYDVERTDSSHEYDIIEGSFFYNHQ